MGTRSLTIVQEATGADCCVMYEQFDGYPEGHGEALKEWAKYIVLVNGLGMRTDNVANGVGCLAAQMVAHFKKEAGGIYLYPSGTRNCGEEWIYTLRAEHKDGTGRVFMKVQEGGIYFPTINSATSQADMKVYYDGPIADFKPIARTEEA